MAASEERPFPALKGDTVSRVLRSRSGPRPGEPFPDFDLRTVAGERIQKADYVGARPLFMLCGRIASPTKGSAASALRRHYEEYGDRVAFVTLYVAEGKSEDPAQPETLEQKLAQARDYQYRERIPWTVAVDSLDGPLEQALDVASHGVYIMARDGTVALRMPQGGDEHLLWDALNAVATELPQVDARDTAPVFRRIATAYRSLPAPVRAAVNLAAGLVPLAVAAGGVKVFRRRRGRHSP